MTSTLSQNALTIRPFQRRDLEEVERLLPEEVETEGSAEAVGAGQLQVHRWYGVLKSLSLFPNPLQHLFCAYVAEQGGQLRGMIQVSPFNQTRSTWRVDQVLVDSSIEGEQSLPIDVGSQLLRHCFQTIWEARTWLIEVNVNDKATLALYRQNGFQPLAQMTYWAIAPELLQTLSEREPDLPNLLPVGNADACLLHQLDTVSMPPLVRQVFDRHILDFKVGLFSSVIDGLKQRVNHTEVVKSYVFEPQRKAAIGYFQLSLCRKGSQPHSAQLTVHPAYTWLYPELLSQMARVAKVPTQSLRLASSDYQPEREEYLEQLGATRTEHTLMMSRSVWHKLRETKRVSLEGLQIAEVLQGFQPARKPVPSRFSLLDSFRPLPPMKNQDEVTRLPPESENLSPPALKESLNGKANPVSPDLPEEPNC